VAIRKVFRHLLALKALFQLSTQFRAPFNIIFASAIFFGVGAR
jgi:hypothetical protein